MKQKTFESILRRLQGLTPDQTGPLMRSVQDLTAQNAALGAVDQKQGWPFVLIVVLMRRKNGGARGIFDQHWRSPTELVNGFVTPGILPVSGMRNTDIAAPAPQ